MKQSKQQGVAIIMVLMVVALATMLASYISVQQAWWQRQLINQFDRSQAKRISSAAIDWARAILVDDLRVSTNDHANEIWTTRLPSMPVDNGEVTGQIEDRQGYFNLNNLVVDGNVSERHVQQLRRLLSSLSLPEGLAVSLADWMDADSEAQYPDGAEDVYYLSLARPYRCANQPLVDLNELILIKGFDRAIIAKLKPYVTVLPINGPINVNFASAEVLAAVADNLSLSEARVLTAQRVKQPFKDVDDFKKRLPNKNTVFADSDISVVSQFFWVSGRATIGKSLLTTEALLQRMGGWPTVVWQRVQ